MSDQFPLLAKTVAGMEEVLAAELKGIGATEVVPGRRLVHFQGDQRLLYKANIWCRTAIRILKPIASFSATSEQELYERVQATDWAEWLEPDGTLAIDPLVHSSFLTHSLYAAQLTKDAIVDQFRDKFNCRPSVDRDDPDLRINLHINQNQASLYADSSGDSLHKRGYRTGQTEAPISEALAAGILALSNWDRKSAIVDFMCGSGTFLIEAAMLARNIAPGLIRREFGYMWWRDYDDELHQQLLTEAKAAKTEVLTFPILGGDLDANVIEVAKKNAQKAGVLNDLRFEVANFEALRPSAETGTLVCNPPYDERMKASRIGLVYQRIGTVLKSHWRGYNAFIFTGNLEAAEEIGLKPAKKTFLRNGAIECRLLEFHLWKKGPATTAPKTVKTTKPESESENVVPPVVKGDSITADIVTLAIPEIGDVEHDHQASQDDTWDIEQSSPYDNSPDDRDDEENSIAVTEDDSTANDITASLTGEVKRVESSTSGPSRRTWNDQSAALRNRLVRMGKHWAKWARRQGITCYRLYDRDVPEIPLAIDRYDDHLAIAEYERPHDRTDVEQRMWLEQMVETVVEVLQVPRNHIFLKRRERQVGRGQYEKQAAQHAVLHVQEAGHRFEVNLSDYLDTGLFLDHRITRSMVEKEAADKRVLNLFAYTGSFSVYAAAGGAASSVTVDLSNTYLDWAQRNLKLNDLHRPEHEFVRDDAREFLRYYARRHQPAFDLAIVDPPTFSKSKKTVFDWDVQRDHVELLQLVLQHLNPGGKIFFSSNFRRFKFQPEALGDVTTREISRQTVPPDFRNKRIHRCWTIIKK